MRHRPLFVYGMLRDADICTALLGRALDRRNIAAAVAPGFRVVRYPGRHYPALVRVPGGTAEGQLLVGLSGFEHDVLDVFEGDEYRRDVIPVMVEEELHEAEVFLPTAKIAAEAEAWSFSGWQQNHKAAALVAQAEKGPQIRAQLIAARPN
jgi:hypothetical protein